jgi:ribonuclease P protein component
VGNAVTRNRVKRRLRHLALPLVEEPGWELVVRARPAAADVAGSVLAADLEHAWAKVKR